MNVGTIETNNAIPGLSAEKSAITEDPTRHAQSVREIVLSNEHVKRMVAELQEQLRSMNIGLEFSTYGAHGEKIAVVVANKETGEVIREIPSKELQRLYAKMSELAGLIFNGQV